MAAAGCSTADQQQQLQFQQCTKMDAVLIISWSATFLQEVFELPVRPTDAQVCEVGCPPPPGLGARGQGRGVQPDSNIRCICVGGEGAGVLFWERDDTLKFSWACPDTLLLSAPTCCAHTVGLGAAAILGSFL
jgi:hypothetical protein